MGDQAAPSVFERWGDLISDGFESAAEAGIERAVAEIQGQSHNPRTQEVTQHVGRDSDGTTVTEPVEGAVMSSMATHKKVLIGGLVVIGVGLVLTRMVR